MWKNIGKACLFLTVFALLFAGVSPLFIPKDNTPGSGIHEFNAKGFLGEKADTLDVLFLGDSEAYSAFIPLRLWEQTGITSYVCSTGDQMMYQSRSYLERFLRNQSPQVVFLETNALYREFTLDQVLSHEMEERFGFLRYHDRWKKLKHTDLGSSVQFTHTVQERGYLYFDKTVETDTQGYMEPAEEAFPVPHLNKAYFQRMHRLCQNSGVELVLVSTPSPTNWNYYYHNGVAQLAEEMGISYIDLNLMPDEIPVDWSRDSYDGGDHLNYTGACKVTDYMGKTLLDMGSFENKRGRSEYSHWEQALLESGR